MGRLYDAARRLSRRILMAIVVDDGDTPAYPDYLSFTSSGNSTIALTNNGGNAPVVYYSFDRENWTLWDYSAISLTDGQTVYMYGENGGNGGKFSQSTTIRSTFVMTGSIAGGGNVMSLLGEDFENYTAVGNYCFYYLFNNCTALHSSPAFPAVTLGQFCYQYALSQTSITESPYLPATALVAGCYITLFFKCSLLSKITVAAESWNTSWTASWAYDVQPPGIFVCPASLSIPVGVNGIPSGWTREDL